MPAFYRINCFSIRWVIAAQPMPTGGDATRFPHPIAAYRPKVIPFQGQGFSIIH
jgi:hypothetical protein